MVFWYNPPKDSKFASLNCSDWKQVNSKIEFDELRFCSSDEFYYIYARCSKFSGVQKMGEKDFTIDSKTEPVFLTFKVARKDYDKWDYKEKKQVPTEQSRLEKWICKIVDGLDPTKAYTGKLDLQDSNILDIYLSGLDTGGNPIDENLLKTMQATSVSLEPIEPTHISDDEVKLPVDNKTKGSFGGSKGQTELERLNDRLAFMCQQVCKIDESITVSNLFELCKILDHEKFGKDAGLVLNFSTDLMK